MVGVTPEQAFEARELHAAGLWSGRIAELLEVDERLVRQALAGDTFEDDVAPAPAQPVDRTAPPAPIEGAGWPPPVDAATEWDEVQIARGYAQAPEVVRVRWVLLWGQRVRINDQAEVWCHFCLRFHTTAKLGHPFNGCPVGLPHRGGIVRVSGEEMAESDRLLAIQEGRSGPGARDLMREPW